MNESIDDLRNENRLLRRELRAAMAERNLCGAERDLEVAKAGQITLRLEDAQERIRKAETLFDTKGIAEAIYYADAPGAAKLHYQTPEIIEQYMRRARAVSDYLWSDNS